jgi:ubiquinone/menaquinone biosynthesis C-methylase UbiE
MSLFWTKNAVKEVVRRHWSARAETFDQGLTHAPHSPEQLEAWQSRLQRWAGAQPIDVLDVGCGTGFLALQFANLGHRASGADFAETMIERARAKAAEQQLDVQFDVADAENLPHADGSFDLVIERHVAWTLPDPSGAFIEWRRVLRPGGRLILIEGQWSHPDADSPRTPMHADYQEIQDTLPFYGGAPAVELSAAVQTAGFPDANIEPLMDAVLWGGSVDRERYALHATKR